MDIKKIEKIRQLETDNQILKAEQGNGTFHLKSRNTGFNHVLDIARKVALNDSNVPILGESGVGKEVVARSYLMRIFILEEPDA
jgi:DNA-binding NtrC family response regulator